MAEIVKRLKPDLRTVRYLFAHSGNHCAFPACEHPLIDGFNSFVAEVCHIEAAEVGGERFNPSMTNEERRHRANLLLMCHRHHVETNDVARFSVDDMRLLKANHEARFASGSPLPDELLEAAVQTIISSSIVDLTKQSLLKRPQTLTRLADYLYSGGWRPSPEELISGDLALLAPLLDGIQRLPVDTRGVLLLVVERGQSYNTDLGVPFHEVQHASGAEGAELTLHVKTLDRYGIAYMDEDYADDGSIWWIATSDLDGWPVWRALKGYCESLGEPVERLIMDLEFDILD